MESLDQRADADLETGVPCVRVLLDLTEALDQLQQRMLTFHHHSRAWPCSPYTPEVGGLRLPGGRVNL